MSNEDAQGDAPPPKSAGFNNRSGGANFTGNTNVGGDVTGQDKIVDQSTHGDIYHIHIEHAEKLTIGPDAHSPDQAVSSPTSDSELAATTTPLLKSVPWIRRKASIIVAPVILAVIALIVGVFTQIGLKPPGGFNWESCAADNWTPQTDLSSQGIASIAGSNEIAHTGNCSLKINARLQAGHPNFLEGEAFVDLGTAGSFNGVQIACWIYVPSAEARGQTDRWNGAQFFVKDAIFKSAYGGWVNLDHIGWIRVTLTPSTSNPSDGSKVDPGFNPNNVKLIGVKLGVNGQTTSNYAYNGAYYLDDCTW